MEGCNNEIALESREISNDKSGIIKNAIICWKEEKNE